jgi:PLP dependent protein
MMTIKQNIEEIRNSIPAHVKLVAVSKRKPISVIEESWEAGQRIFGENRVQELIEKNSNLKLPVEWHMIGHLQTNKVKFIAPFVSLIQSVDSFKLLQEINKEAIKNNRIIPCLLQFYIAKEESKFGFNEEELYEMIESKEFNLLKGIKISGLMGMATYTENTNQVRSEFKLLNEIFNTVKKEFFFSNTDFCEKSMGMSGDYKIAIDEGSTMIRLGSILFGDR